MSAIRRVKLVPTSGKDLRQLIVLRVPTGADSRYPRACKSWGGRFRQVAGAGLRVVGYVPLVGPRWRSAAAPTQLLRPEDTAFSAEMRRGESSSFRAATLTCTMQCTPSSVQRITPASRSAPMNAHPNTRIPSDCAVTGLGCRRRKLTHLQTDNGRAPGMLNLGAQKGIRWPFHSTRERLAASIEQFKSPCRQPGDARLMWFGRSTCRFSWHSLSDPTRATACRYGPNAIRPFRIGRRAFACGRRVPQPFASRRPPRWDLTGKYSRLPASPGRSQKGST